MPTQISSRNRYLPIIFTVISKVSSNINLFPIARSTIKTSIKIPTSKNASQKMWSPLRRLFGRGKKTNSDTESVAGDYQPDDVSIGERNEMESTIDENYFSNEATVRSFFLIFLVT